MSNNIEEVLAGIREKELKEGVQNMISSSYSAAKSNTSSKQASQSVLFYWMLFAIFILIMLNMAFDVVHIKGIYYILFTSVILFNFLFIWLINHRDQINDVQSVLNNWDFLPNIGKASFTNNIRAKIAEKAIFGGASDNLFKWLKITVYILTPILLANAIWQDRDFTARSFLIFLLSLMLVAVLHMHISVEKEWHSLRILGDRELLESYKKTLSDGYYRMVIMSAIILTIACVFGSWLLFGDVISKAWEALF